MNKNKIQYVDDFGQIVPVIVIEDEGNTLRCEYLVQINALKQHSIRKSNVYASVETAKSAILERDKEYIDQCLASIDTVGKLVQFASQHDMNIPHQYILETKAKEFQLDHVKLNKHFEQQQPHNKL